MKRAKKQKLLLPMSVAKLNKSFVIFKLSSQIWNWKRTTSSTTHPLHQAYL